MELSAADLGVAVAVAASLLCDLTLEVVDLDEVGVRLRLLPTQL